MSEGPCVICGVKSMSSSGGDYFDVNCSNCGEFRISGSATALLFQGHYSEAPFDVKCKQGVLSYLIRKSQTSTRLEVYSDFVDSAFSRPPLSPMEHVKNLVFFIGNFLVGRPGEAIKIEQHKMRALIGTTLDTDVSWVIQQARDMGLIADRNSLRLTLTGWNYYEELKRGATDSKMAFMAMKFGEEPLTSVFQDHFRPAVARTGFHLETVIGKKKAGSIDDKIRVEIRNARFVVVDLTHGNQGAYFEAGFAEGLGKPVIYTCEEIAFDKGRGTHFDCNHHHTVVWKESDPGQAVEELVDVIRNTLPGEAIMTDK